MLAEPESIIGCTMYNKEFIFLVKYKDMKLAEFVPVKRAVQMWPSFTLEYFESSLFNV